MYNKETKTLYVGKKELDKIRNYYSNTIDYEDSLELNKVLFNEVETIVFDDEVELIDVKFNKFTHLKKVVIPGSVKEIKSSCFETNYELENVELGYGIKKIGAFSFNHTAIKQIELPDSIREIGIGAFRYCSDLQSIKLPIGLKELSKSTFANCENLKSVKFNENLEKIDRDCFENCSNLRVLDLPENLKEIGIGAFSGCEGLKRVDLNHNLETINDRAFSKCTSLTSLVIPFNVTTIGDGAFFFDKNLEIINIPGSVKVLKRNTLVHCDKLKTLELNEGLEKIEENAISTSNSLDGIKLPNSLKELNVNFISSKEDKIEDLYITPGVKLTGTASVNKNLTKINSLYINAYGFLFSSVKGKKTNGVEIDLDRLDKIFKDPDMDLLNSIDKASKLNETLDILEKYGFSVDAKVIKDYDTLLKYNLTNNNVKYLNEIYKHYKMEKTGLLNMIDIANSLGFYNKKTASSAYWDLALLAAKGVFKGTILEDVNGRYHLTNIRNGGYNEVFNHLCGDLDSAIKLGKLQAKTGGRGLDVVYEYCLENKDDLSFNKDEAIKYATNKLKAYNLTR